MRPVRTVLVALAGLALPVGLALALYLSSAGTIAATPVSLPPSAVGQGNPDALEDKTTSKRPAKKKHERDRAEGSTAGTTTVGNDGVSTTTTSVGTGTADDGSGADSSGSGSGSDRSGGDD